MHMGQSFNSKTVYNTLKTYRSEFNTHNIPDGLEAEKFNFEVWFSVFFFIFFLFVIFLFKR